LPPETYADMLIDAHIDAMCESGGTRDAWGPLNGRPYGSDMPPMDDEPMTATQKRRARRKRSKARKANGTA
jgi:hypothetical protein